MTFDLRPLNGKTRGGIAPRQIKFNASGITIGEDIYPSLIGKRPIVDEDKTKYYMEFQKAVGLGENPYFFTIRNYRGEGGRLMLMRTAHYAEGQREGSGLKVKLGMYDLIGPHEIENQKWFQIVTQRKKSFTESAKEAISQNGTH